MITPWYQQKFHRRFRKGSRKGHGIHSPFMFDFITNIVENPHPFYAFEDLGKTLKILYKSKEAIKVPEWGHIFGLKNAIYSEGTVARRTEVAEKTGELIFRIINKFSCRNIVHYGPTLGINLLYLAKVNQKNRIQLIAQIKECSKVSNTILQKYSISDFVEKTEQLKYPNDKSIDLALINFPQSVIQTSQAIESVLPCCKEESIIVIRGINSNKAMKNWWNEFKSNQKKGITLDLNIIGLYFLRSDLQNQHFIY